MVETIVITKHLVEEIQLVSFYWLTISLVAVRIIFTRWMAQMVERLLCQLSRVRFPVLTARNLIITPYGRYKFMIVTILINGTIIGYMSTILTIPFSHFKSWIKSPKIKSKTKSDFNLKNNYFTHDKPYIPQENAETITLEKKEQGLGFSLLGQQDGKRIVRVSNIAFENKFNSWL